MAREWKFVCSVAAMNKNTLVSSSFGCYFTASFLRHLAYTFSREAKERDEAEFNEFSSVSINLDGANHQVCQFLCALPEHQTIWHTRVSQRTRFKALDISGRISSQLAVFTVLTARRASATVMVFSSKNVSRVCSVVWTWLGSKDRWSNHHLQRMTFSLLSKIPFGIWWI